MCCERHFCRAMRQVVIMQSRHFAKPIDMHEWLLNLRNYPVLTDHTTRADRVPAALVSRPTILSVLQRTFCFLSVRVAEDSLFPVRPHCPCCRGLFVSCLTVLSPRCSDRADDHSDDGVVRPRRLRQAEAGHHGARHVPAQVGTRTQGG